MNKSMHSELETKLWKAGQEEQEYSKKIWLKIIDALLDDFQEFIGYKFERNTDICLSLEQPHFPEFSIWIDSYKQENCSLTTKWLTKIGADIGIKNENLHFPIEWSAVMSGHMIPSKDYSMEVFEVVLYMFIYRPNEKKRLHLKNNESIIVFVFEKNIDKKSQWGCTGWHPDYYGEWED